MNDEQIYQELKNLAEKLELSVQEHTLRHPGLHVKSGYCIVKDKKQCIIDRKLRLREKIGVLAECLGAIPHEHLFMVPAIRELIDLPSPRYEKKGPQRQSVKKFT